MVMANLLSLKGNGGAGAGAAMGTFESWSARQACMRNEASGGIPSSADMAAYLPTCSKLSRVGVGRGCLYGCSGKRSACRLPPAAAASEIAAACGQIWRYGQVPVAYRILHVVCTYGYIRILQ